MSTSVFNLSDQRFALCLNHNNTKINSVINVKIQSKKTNTNNSKSENRNQNREKNMQIRTLFRNFCLFLCTIYRYKISPWLSQNVSPFDFLETHFLTETALATIELWVVIRNVTFILSYTRHSLRLRGMSIPIKYVAGFADEVRWIESALANIRPSWSKAHVNWN